MKRLTSRQWEILRQVRQARQVERFLSVSDLVSRLGLAGASSLMPTLASIERKGYLSIHRQGKGQNRFIELTPRGLAEVTDEVAPTDAIPRLRVPILGAIPAGPLSEAVQSAEEFVTPDEMLRVQVGDFFLRVHGNSMVGDGILPGDLALLRPGIQLGNGEIAAVQISQDNGVYNATLKHVHYSPRQKMARLRASNPAYEDLLLPAKDVEVVGVYRGLIRRL